MESEAEMKTLDNRVSSLEKRIDKHSAEIDMHGERLAVVESNQKVFELQLETLVKIEDGIVKINENIGKLNNVVVENKHKTDVIDRELAETKQKTKELEVQRNIDHNIKPLESYQSVKQQVIMLIVAAIAGMVLAKIGL